MMRWQNPWRCPTVRSGAGSCFSCFAVWPETEQSFGCFAAYTGTGRSSWTLPQADLKQNHPLAGPQPELAQEDYINFSTWITGNRTPFSYPTAWPGTARSSSCPTAWSKAEWFSWLPQTLTWCRKIHQLTHSLTWCMIIFQLLQLEVVKWVTGDLNYPDTDPTQLIIFSHHVFNS